VTGVKIAIIGSGPAGLSAACRAAEMGDAHVLLEAEPHLSNTIYRYQKRKHVMAEPAALPLRAACRFEPGRREEVLGRWAEDVQQRGVNVRLRSAVTAVSPLPAGSGFHLTLADGSALEAATVVMAIGMQGNPRKLGCPGEVPEAVQYQLDDPDAHQGEVIVVVGAGDAAIENALALAERNEVHVVNRKGEFSRAKDGNNAAILRAIEEGRLRCHYHANPEMLSAGGSQGKPWQLTLSSKDGTLTLPCDRVIARLGATPPREFLEACGVRFTGSGVAALPALTSQYESSVPGLYIVGALAGNPLIKQAINQGYEVVERIMRRPVTPADEPLLRETLAPLLTGGATVADTVEKIGRASCRERVS
jgi:thioredoxin reductase